MIGAFGQLLQITIIITIIIIITMIMQHLIHQQGQLCLNLTLIDQSVSLDSIWLYQTIDHKAQMKKGIFKRKGYKLVYLSPFSSTISIF